MSFQNLRVNLKLTQKQVLTPGLVQMVTVLALNKLELKDMINQEMVENPILEELAEEEAETPSSEEMSEEEDRRVGVEARADRETQDAAGTDPLDEIDLPSFFEDYLADPGYRGPSSEVIERPSFENFLSNPTTLSDHLHWQLSLSPAEANVRDAAESIIGNLNEDGFLTASAEEIAQSGGHSLETVKEALKLVQEFDPAGVAARDLRECLRLQLQVLGLGNGLAWQIVHDHLSMVQNKQFKELARAVNRAMPDIETALKVIRKLDPRPGQRYNKTEPQLIEPDVFFVKNSDEYQVAINDDDLPQLRLNTSYRKLLDRGASERDVRTYVKDRYTSAMQLIKNIEQRRQTIEKVCNAIIKRQRDFLDHGIDQLKPMMIKEVAEEVGVHASTVSRAVANKYAHTPQGVYELRYFFSEAVQGPSGADTSLITLKRKVKKMIEDEDPTHPLTDDQITRILQSNGIMVTRRTVAKYREDMKIPSTHQRRVKN